MTRWGLVMGIFLLACGITEGADTKLKKSPDTGSSAAGQKGARTDLKKQANCWKVTEVVLESSKEYDNPYKDVDVEAEFTCGAVSIRRPGFWDGERTWKVRFAPTTTGKWTYATKCTDTSNPGLHGKEGSIDVVPYSGTNPNYVHGFLKVKQGDELMDKRYLVYQDGTPFFWLGDTHSMAPEYERVDKCNHPDHKGKECPYGGQFQHLVHIRKTMGYTAYQLHPAGECPMWWTHRYDKLNPKPFREKYDVMMDSLAENGFITALGMSNYKWSIYKPTDPHPPVDEETLVRFARYHVARYGAHPVVWITGLECTGAGKLSDMWRKAAIEIDKQDGYGHPQSYHQMRGPITTWWDEPWHEWGCTQGAHKNLGHRTKDEYFKFWSYKIKKPWLEAEHMFEIYERGTAKDARIAAYKSKLCGSFGYNYGVDGIWGFGFFRWETKGNARAWYDAVNQPGSTQMTHFASIFTSMEWWNLNPCFNSPDCHEFVHPEESIQAKSDNVRVVYFYHEDPKTGKLKGLDGNRKYNAKWFDPRTGESKAISAEIVPINGDWEIPDKPDAEDWVLVYSGREKLDR